MSPARIVAAGEHTDPLQEAFSFKSAEALFGPGWFEATCKACAAEGKTTVYEVKSLMLDGMAFRLADRNAMLAHAKGAHDERTLRRRK